MSSVPIRRRRARPTTSPGWQARSFSFCSRTSEVRSGNRHRFRFGASGMHSLEQVIADAQRVGYDGEPWIDRATRAKEACIDHVKIIQLVRFAVAIERARLRVVAEADGTVLVRHAGERDALAEIQIAREEALVAFVAVHGTLGLLLH